MKTQRMIGLPGNSVVRHRVTVTLAVQLAVFGASISISHAQVTFQQITNSLVDYYPLDSLTPGNSSTTPDLINRRDMILVNMTSNNIVGASHPGIESSRSCLYFNQSGGPTVMYYQTTGQNPLDGWATFYLSSTSAQPR